jgi:D-alanine-D-alanine ligase-like ATP-grasp enzyme
MYSNTPTDFDFKLDSLAQGFKSLSEFMEHLVVSTDIVFPLIHGKFGEDGSIQEFIEKAPSHYQHMMHSNRQHLPNSVAGRL